MNTIAKFAKLGKILSLIAIILVISPFIYSFTATGGATTFDLVFSLGVPTLFISFGYLLQMLMSKINGYKRKEIIFEDEIKYFDLGAAVLPILVSAFCAIPYHLIYKAYRIANEGHIDMYDLDLYLVPVLCSAVMIFGIMLWFLPYHKLMHKDMIYAYGALLLGDFVICIIFSVPTLFLTVASVVFLLIFFTVSNLRSIEEALSVSKFRVPSNNFRSYNMKLTLKHFVVTIVSALVVFSFVFLLISLFQPDIQIDPEQQIAENLPLDSGSTGGGGSSLYDIYSKSKGPILIFCYVAIGVTLISIILWFIRQKHLLKRFFRMVAMVFASIGEFVEFLLRMFEKNHPAAKLLPDNYVDREIECFSDFREFKIKEELTRQSFNANLEAKQSLEEKYAYAYSVYALLVRGHKYGIKASDTPRMITAKLCAQRKEELTTATPVFEDIRYRTVIPDPELCQKELKKLVKLVRERL